MSAAQAIGTAAQAGQKIYTITRAVYANNPNIVGSALSVHSIETQEVVQNALDVGLEVTIHERPVTISGWSGAGYTTIDPNTGAGGYFIEGGSNGGTLLGLALGLVSGLALILASPLVAGFVGAIGLLIGAYFALTLSIDELLNFSGARLIGTLAGIILAVVLGGYVLISFPVTFVLGIAWLLFTLIRLFPLVWLSKLETHREQESLLNGVA